MKLLALLGLFAIGTNALRVAEQKHNGLQAWYTFNEKPKSSRCKNDNECDGWRYCQQSGWCQGTARYAKDAQYYYTEITTGGKCPKGMSDPNWINRDYYCDGNRKCALGLCYGKAR